MANSPPARRTFLFLQGPISPFFRRLGADLRGRGHKVLHVNLNVGDALFWSGEGVRAYRGRQSRWPGWVGALMDREGVTDLVLLGEQRPSHKAAIAEADRRGIRVTVTDFGYMRPDWIVIERDGMNALSRFPRDPAELRRRAADLPTPDLAIRYRDQFLITAVWDVTYHLASYFFGFLFPFYRSHQLDNPVAVYLGTGWRLWRKPARERRVKAIIERARDSGAPTFLFAMQLEMDYSLRSYSEFPDMTAALRLAIGSFTEHAPADARLLVKLHPFDPGLKDWRARVDEIAAEAGVRDRVEFIDGGDLADLFAFIRGVVTVNSTLGVAAMHNGLPVVALGQAVYRIRGLTFEDGLDRFWTEARAPDRSLMQAFTRVMAADFHVRGVYYSDPGLAAGVRAAADRLEADEVLTVRAAESRIAARS